MATILWRKNDDYSPNIEQTTDSGYIVAGTSKSHDGDITYNHGGSDCWVLKLKKNGIIQWQKAYGGNGSEGAGAIHQTEDGNYIMAGNAGSDNSGDIVNFHRVGDYWILKLKPDGNIKWQKSFWR